MVKVISKPAKQKPLRDVKIADRYDLEKDNVFITGNQAVVRLTLTQKERDRRAGLNTGGYVSGYRGSPIGGLDLAMWKEQTQLTANDIVFEPGVNEDLAATALWGTQQAEMRGEGRFDGVFGIWYGKGPGVDRTGDVFRHANLAGTSKNGGVLVLMGDDHTAESSTTAHQSEFHLLDIMIPVLSPAGVQEILDYGVFGFGLSRYASVWVGIKCVKDTIESTAVVDGRVDRMKLVNPKPDRRPKGGLSIRPRDPILEQEARLHECKRDAILDYVAVNKINKTILSGGRKPRIGVITSGKSYLDVRQALDDLGLDEVRANDLGLRLYKLGCVWPLSRKELRAFGKDLDQIIVVEEKRGLIEVQVREDHRVHVRHVPARFRDRVRDGPLLERINPAFLLAEFVADARLDHDFLAIAFEQHRVLLERHAVEIVRFDGSGPHRPRDDAHHRARVEAERPAPRQLPVPPSRFVRVHADRLRSHRSLEIQKGDHHNGFAKRRDGV